MKLCQYGFCSLLKYFYKPDSASSLATGYSRPPSGDISYATAAHGVCDYDRWSEKLGAPSFIRGSHLWALQFW